MKSHIKSITDLIKIDNELNLAKCDVKKRVGFTYFYYLSKTNGQKCLSIISPKEWNAQAWDFEFLGGKLHLPITEMELEFLQIILCFNLI